MQMQMVIPLYFDSFTMLLKDYHIHVLFRVAFQGTSKNTMVCVSMEYVIKTKV